MHGHPYMKQLQPFVQPDGLLFPELSGKNPNTLQEETNVKKLVSLVMVVLMAMVCFAGCEGAETTEAGAADTITIGMVGCYTGDYAVYGTAVKTGAELYFDEINAAGGINCKKINVIAYDNKGDMAETITAFNRIVDEGAVALLGAVLTGNTIAVVGEAYPIGMPVVTASATAAAVTYDPESDTVFSNTFRTCFIDPFQGEKMAAYAIEKLGAKNACLIIETGNDYAVGVAEAFAEKFIELGGTILSQEGYATGDKNFKAQLTNIASQNPDVVFSPNYYQDDGMIISQGREVGLACPFLGADGFAGISDYASAEDLEGCLYCSGYAPASTEGVKAFEAAYEAKFGEAVPNMFSPLAYDAAKLLCAAIAKAEESDAEYGSDAYKQAIIAAIPEVGPEMEGVTSASGYSFDEFNNPIKDANIMELVGGVETFKEMY